MALVVAARHGAALHSAGEEPCGDRDGHLHEGERQWPRRLEPGAVPGRAAGPRHRACAWTRDRAPSRSTSRCFSIGSTRSARTSSGSGETADLEGMFPKLRAQVIGNPVTGEAYLLLDAPENPPPPMALGFKPDRAYIPSMPTTLAAMRDRVPEVLERAEATLQVLERHRRQDSRQPRPKRPLLHQRRAHRSAERSAGAERRFAEVLRDDQRADRADHVRAGSGDRHPRDAGDVHRRGARRDQGGRSSGHESVGAHRGRPDRARGRRSAALAAGHSGFARTAARARAAAPGAAGVGGLWSPPATGKR